MRFSALRRIRVARWSTRNSSASSSESVARRSIASSRPELAVQQGLAAPGQAEEDVADAAAQLGLLDRDPHRGLLDRLNAWPDLADLVAAEVQRWRLGVDVDPLAVLQPLHHPRQPVRRPARCAASRSRSSWRTSFRAVVIEIDDGRDDGDQAEHAGQHQPDDDADGRRLRPGHDLVHRGELQIAELGEGPIGGVAPRLGGHRQRGGRGPCHDRVFQAREPNVVVAAQQCVEPGPVGFARSTRTSPCRKRRVPTNWPNIGLLRACELSGGERAGDQGVLPGENLTGVDEAHQRTSLLGEFRVVPVGQGAVDGERRVDNCIEDRDA